MTSRNIAVFILRRIVRIYPLYLVQIAAAGVFLAFTNEQYFDHFKATVISLLFFSSSPTNVWMGYSIGVLWTLYVEFWFYVTFPILLLAISSFPGSRQRNLLCGFACLTLLSWLYKLEGGSAEILAYYDHFLIGAASAVVVHYKIIPPLFSERSAHLFGLFLVVAMVMKAYPGERNLYWHLQSLVAAFGTAIFIIGTAARPPKLSMALGSRIGQISYSIYLVHALILDMYLTIGYPMNLVTLAIYSVFVLAISSQSYRFIEQPTIQRAHKYLRFNVTEKPANF